MAIFRIFLGSGHSYWRIERKRCCCFLLLLGVTLYYSSEPLVSLALCILFYFSMSFSTAEGVSVVVGFYLFKF